jgi:hypothetical protein
MARVYTNNQSAPLQLYVTKHEAGPRALDAEWTSVKTFQITNNLFETYFYKPPDGRAYRAFKLVTQTQGSTPRRVCVEELAVAEPVFPGFQIAGVTPLCAVLNGFGSRQQPLHTDAVGIQAQLSNFMLPERMSNVQLFVSYYVGTNHWGIGNWPVSETRTLPMPLVDASAWMYRSDPLDAIPPQEKNAVVQYYVWATYQDIDGVQLTTRQQDGSFTNPEWYYPIDLNQTFRNRGWSPHYIVYDVPVGMVWINEINANDTALSGPNSEPHYFGENKFVEIAVPAGFDLAGWTLDIVSRNRSVSTITLPTGSQNLDPVVSNYVFYVIGEMTAPAGVPPMDRIDYKVNNLATKLPYYDPGGIRLRRPLGMYEQCVAYDSFPDWGPEYPGAPWTDADPEHRFEFVGTEVKGGSLSVTNTPESHVPVPADWVTNLVWTPGLPNVGQVLPSGIWSDVSNAVISTSMLHVRGSQNGLRVATHQFKVEVGDSTNIQYVADSWYRLISVKVNGVERLTAETPSYVLDLPNVQSNMTVQVDFALRSDIGSLNLRGDVLEWLLGFGDAPFAPTWYGRNPYNPASDRRELSLIEQYWIDANPTLTNYLTGGVVGVARNAASTNYFVTVALDLNGTNVTRLLGGDPRLTTASAVFKIEARQPPNVQDWRMLRQFKFDEQSFDASHRSSVYVFNPFTYILPPPADPDGALAFRWVLEYMDPQFTAPILTNTPSATLP